MFVEDVLIGAVRSGTAVLFAAQGEVIAERSGVINLGTEGCMLTGALAAFATASWSGSPWLGVAAAVGVGLFMGCLHAFFVVTRRANQLATGLAITFLALGVTAALGSDYVAKDVNPLNPVPIPLLSDVPFVGPILFDHDILTYCGLALGPLLWLFLKYTRWGLVLRATGESGAVAFAYGHSPSRVRYLAVMAGGALAAVGGAQLVLAYTLNWVENVTVGRGFVAVALVIFAAWNPLKATAGAFVFGGAVSLQLQLQARGVDISPFLLNMTPYILTLAILVATSRGRAQRAPDEIRAVFGTAGA
ncbi:MAG TPA: ABC transporter permease [Gaiella sp.]|jgi:simple sugar transport system permease protein